MSIDTTWRRLAGGAAAALLFSLAGCGSSEGPGDLVAKSAYTAPAGIAGTARKLIYRMSGLQGLVHATALLFEPPGTAPAGGWPVVVWVHGTTTVGTGAPAASTCSASESPTLDGGLSADGFTSHYVQTIGALVGAGYAVLAPELEGLGAEAQARGVAHAYYNLASSGRAVGAALVAAHQASASLSGNWASVGHSEGGHVVLGLETTAADVSAYSYKGTVAFAPFNSIEASVGLLDTLVGADPANEINYRTAQQLFVGMMATSLATQQSSFAAASVMGADLLALMPTYRSQCIFKVLGAVGLDVATKTPAAFQGYTSQWASNPAMQAFLRTNDEAVNPGFRVAKPTLVLQGTTDPFVFESLQAGFAGKLVGAGMPVTYTTYTGADHSTIMVQGQAAMLAFLHTILP